MEWVKAITALISSIAWPATILALVILFRREIRRRLEAVREVTYPGGSITLQEVERLEASVEGARVSPPPAAPTEEPPLPFTDPKLVIAQGRIDVERELFRLSWRALGYSAVTNWHTARHVDELEQSNVITPQFARNLRAFIDVANRIVHGTGVTPDLVSRTAAIAGEILATLRFKRLIYEAQKDFEGHGIWHMRGRMKEDVNERNYIKSAVASQIAEYGYDYDVYRGAVELFNQRQRSDSPPAPGCELPVLSLDEFVEVLKWREDELERLRNDLRTAKWDQYDEVNMWKWPPAWGHLGWSSGILRDRVSQFNAEQELMQTRAALERHRARQLAEKRRNGQNAEQPPAPYSEPAARSPQG